MVTLRAGKERRDRGERGAGLTSACAVPAELAAHPGEQESHICPCGAPVGFARDGSAQSQKGETKAVDHAEMGSGTAPVGFPRACVD